MQSKTEEYLVLISMVRHNKTLKSLNLKGRGCLTLTDDEDKQMAALLQKNYALESLPDIHLLNGAEDVSAILRLNATVRRYVTEDGSSISKGVIVLSAVRNEINCVFLHLLKEVSLRRPQVIVTIHWWIDKSSESNWKARAWPGPT
jgi:hypothetical protein